MQIQRKLRFDFDSVRLRFVRSFDFFSNIPEQPLLRRSSHSTGQALLDSKTFFYIARSTRKCSRAIGEEALNNSNAQEIVPPIMMALVEMETHYTQSGSLWFGSFQKAF